MSVFKNIRVYPHHGARSAVLTWELPDTPTGDVYVAYSETGTQGTWNVLNAAAPVASGVGMYQDLELAINGGAQVGYYRLMLTNADGDHFSEPIGLLGDLTPREYGMVRAIIAREFIEMRATNGYPVWHCIPKITGPAAANVDLETGEIVGLECLGAASPSFGLPIMGGFHPPLLTWIRALKIDRGTIQDSESDMSPRETDTTDIRMLAFPRPSRGHMIVDPATDRRYLIGDEIKPFLLRGVVPIAYETSMSFLSQGDPRYRFPVPVVDTKSYRRIPYWT